jgi:hypothetical protein
MSGFTSRFHSFTRHAPRREGWFTGELGSKYVKAVVGGFQQGAIIGLGLQFTTADAIKPVEFRATLLTSPVLYRRFEGEAYVPKIFDQNTHADIWFDYIRRTKDDFFGIGQATPNLRTNFDWEQRSYNATLFHDFTSRVSLGGYVSVANSSTYKGARTSDPSIGTLFSGDPATVPPILWAPGLFVNTEILSYGGFAQFDARDNSHGLTKGAYLYGRVGAADGLKDHNAFSDYGWVEGEADARVYIPLGSDKTSLALRGYALLKSPRGNSQIPFYDLSFLGGRLEDRGYRNYRFRGDNLALVSVELRQTVWTLKEDRGLDLFAFGDAGEVWGDNRSGTDPAILANRDFRSKFIRGGLGGGVEFRYSRRLAGRIEIGHSYETTKVYLSLTRGF